MSHEIYELQIVNCMNCMNILKSQNSESDFCQSAKVLSSSLKVKLAVQLNLFLLDTITFQLKFDDGVDWHGYIFCRILNHDLYLYLILVFFPLPCIKGEYMISLSDKVMQSLGPLSWNWVATFGDKLLQKWCHRNHFSVHLIKCLIGRGFTDT